MVVAGKIFKGAVHLNEKLRRTRVDIAKSQENTLRKLLRKAAGTDFGKAHGFEQVLRSQDIGSAYQKHVPIYDYERIHAEWWNRAIKGERDVCWPGKVDTFALSSGTTGASSKRIPVTRDMILAMRKASFRHLCTLSNHKFPSTFYNKQMLFLGGCTHLTQVEQSFEGDLSGILGSNIPTWMNMFYRPDSSIATIKDWDKKLDRIAQVAPEWDISIIAGVPAWVKLLLERIIEQHGLDSIYDIWPSFRVYVHGGVAMGHYRDSFRELLGDEVICLETYLASEGFIAFERYNGNGAMSMVLDNGIFYEFVPFNPDNFGPDGMPLPGAMAIPLNKVRQDEEYALLLSTCAGTWRYLLGDTVRFTDVNRQEMVITGRTRQFMSLTGEHLSVDNMTEAVSQTANELGFRCNEFTMVGMPYENMFAHQWWVGTDRAVNARVLQTRLDELLKEINDDYRTEREFAIKEVKVNAVPNERFIDWMKTQGKFGSQNKFPRVLNAAQRENWERFLATEA